MVCIDNGSRLVRVRVCVRWLSKRRGRGFWILGSLGCQGWVDLGFVGCQETHRWVGLGFFACEKPKVWLILGLFGAWKPNGMVSWVVVYFSTMLILNRLSMSLIDSLNDGLFHKMYFDHAPALSKLFQFSRAL